MNPGQRLSENASVARLLAARTSRLTSTDVGRCVVVLASCNVRLYTTHRRSTQIYLQLLAVVKNVDEENGTVEVAYHSDHGCESIPKDGHVSSEFIVGVFDKGVSPEDMAADYTFEPYPKKEPEGGYISERFLYARRIIVDEADEYIYFAVHQMALDFDAQNGSNPTRRIARVRWTDDDAALLESLRVQNVDLSMLPAGHLRDENKNIISPDRVTEGQVIRIYWSLGHFMFGDDAGDCLEPCRVIKFVNGDDDLTNMVDGDDDRGDDGGDAADEQMEEPSGEGGEPDGADASDQAQRGEQLVGDETQHHSHADSHTPRPPAAHESTSQGSGEAKLPEEVGTFGRVESSNDGVPAEDGLESLYRHPVIKTPAVDGMELMNESATNSHDPSFGDFFADEVDEPSMEVANVPPLPSLKHPFPTPAEEVDRKKAKSDRPQHDDSMMD
ncbi:hypothetical protein THAOC_12051, partial [Thalassiosira oceanica]